MNCEASANKNGNKVKVCERSIKNVSICTHIDSRYFSVWEWESMKPESKKCHGHYLYYFQAKTKAEKLREFLNQKHETEVVK